LLGELELLDRSSQTRLLAVLTAASMGAMQVGRLAPRLAERFRRHILQVHFGRQVSNTRFPPYLVDGGDSAFTVTGETIAACDSRQRRLVGLPPQRPSSPYRY